MEIIRKNGRRTNLAYEQGTGTGGVETTESIKTKLGAASATNDGYLKKEDFVAFQNNTGGSGSSFDFGTISSPNNSFTLDFGTL